MELKTFANGVEYVEIKTAKGVLKIYESLDKEYRGAYIDFEPTDGNGIDIPLVSVENPFTEDEKTDNIAIRVWGDPWNEEYTNRIDVSVDEIKKALASEE